MLFGGGGCAVDPPPNVVIIVTDNQHVSTLYGMNNANILLAKKGITFTNAFVTTPTDDPSLASLLTGKRAIHHHVETSYDGTLLDPESTLAVALKGRGYSTALVGRYLTNWAGHPTPPIGWDEFYAWRGGNRYYDYDLNINGTVARFGVTSNEYSTDVFADFAVEFVTVAPEPFFLYVATTAPHDASDLPNGYAKPALRHENLFEGTGCVTSAATLEDDISDKPPHIHEMRHNSGRAPIPMIMECQKQRARKEALLAVDELIADVVHAIQKKGPSVLENTIFILTSDSGQMAYEHWWNIDGTPYEESVHVPMLVRYDRLLYNAAGSERAEIVLNIDITPTVAGLANAPLLNLDGKDWSMYYHTGKSWRMDFPIEYFSEPSLTYPFVESVSWTGVHSPHWTYIRYQDRFEEYYNREADPSQLDNAVITNPNHPGIAPARLRHEELH
jgi:arylsulfatase A-like enzyme